jgi:hypothetical protein
MVRTHAKQIWKMRVEDQPSRRPSPLVRTSEALYENYLQRAYDRPNDSASPSGHGSQIGKIFREILRISVAQLSVRTAHDHRLDVAQVFQSSRPFEPSAYK